MEKTLFLGNGLNRTLDNGLSWAEVMRELGSTCCSEECVPFPIEFEEMAANNGCTIGRRAADPYVELRSLLAEEIMGLGLGSNKCHGAFRDLNMDHVITTNYDLIFDSIFAPEKVITNPGSSRNILKPISRTQTTDFFHAHGIAQWKNTLCLGHEHYASLMGKIRDEFYSKDNEGATENLTPLVTGNRPCKHIWPELLFTTDVAIVGLGLDYCEIDLWWLLSMRAALFQPSNNLTAYENEIIYYWVDTGVPLSPYEQGKHRALRALSVSPLSVPASNYSEGYLEIARKLKTHWAE